MDSKRHYFILGIMVEDMKCLIDVEDISVIIQEDKENAKTRIVLKSGREITLKNETKEILNQLKEISWKGEYYFNT